MLLSINDEGYRQLRNHLNENEEFLLFMCNKFQQWIGELID